LKWGFPIIQITKDISIREGELEYSSTRASGPGGQHVNRAATAVQIRFDVEHSPSLPEDVRERLVRLAGSRMTQEGELIVESQRFRSQYRNRQDALQRLIELIRKAAKRPRRRRPTKPTRASKERRLRQKRHRSRIKKLRRPPTPQE
jgi:ribosome-associated protein